MEENQDLVQEKEPLTFTVPFSKRAVRAAMVVFQEWWPPDTGHRRVKISLENDLDKTEEPWKHTFIDSSSRPAKGRVALRCVYCCGIRRSLSEWWLPDSKYTSHRPVKSLARGPFCWCCHRTVLLVEHRLHDCPTGPLETSPQTLGQQGTSTTLCSTEWYKQGW